MIIDSDVLIWSLRGNTRARDAIQQEVPFRISVVTFIEIVQGMKNRRELETFLRQIKTWSVTILQIDSGTSERAMTYVEEYFLSHSIGLGDALIAATAYEAGEKLLTANEKHYRQIKGLKLEKFSL